MHRVPIIFLMPLTSYYYQEILKYLERELILICQFFSTSLVEKQYSSVQWSGVMKHRKYFITVENRQQFVSAQISFNQMTIILIHKIWVPAGKIFFFYFAKKQQCRTEYQLNWLQQKLPDAVTIFPIYLSNKKWKARLRADEECSDLSRSYACL